MEGNVQSDIAAIVDSAGMELEVVHQVIFMEGQPSLHDVPREVCLYRAESPPPRGSIAKRPDAKQQSLIYPGEYA